MSDYDTPVKPDMPIAFITEGSFSLNIRIIAEATILTLLKVKFVPISPLHPDVPNTIFAGAVFSLANFSMVESSPLFFVTSDNIALQFEKIMLIREGNLLGMGKLSAVLTDDLIKQAFDIDVEIKRADSGETNTSRVAHSIYS